MDKGARILKYIAGEADAGRRVRDIIRDEFHLVAHDIARAKYRTERGITVNGEVSLVNRMLKLGDIVEVRLAYEHPGKIVPYSCVQLESTEPLHDGGLDILYEDEDVLCVNKPAGIVVHPSHGHFADTLSNQVAAYYLSKNEPHEVRPVGRLDKDTSGVLLFGKSRTAAAILAGQVQMGPALGRMHTSLDEDCRPSNGRQADRQMPECMNASSEEDMIPYAAQKEYLAIAEGVFAEESGMIEAPISREYEEKIRRVVREDGDFAVTHFRVIRQYENFAILHVTIETGRTHQIRVHMAHIGHPLVGDPIYGMSNTMGRAALHAWRVTFRQPFSGEVRVVTAPVPQDMLDFHHIYI